MGKHELLRNIEKKIRAYALKNAIAYKGKANKGSVISSLFHEGLSKEEIKDYLEKIDKIVSEVNSLSLSAQKREFDELKNFVSGRISRQGLPELPSAEKGKVIMRFAPSASGPLHAGHALTASLSYLFVKKYGGKFYIRIEDTNPENIYAPAYKMIEQDAKWLFGDEVEIVIQSKRMNLYYEYAESLIKKKHAYVCTCSPENFRRLAKEKKECPCRSLAVSENLSRWEMMLSGKNYKQGDAVLRFKTSEEDYGMKNPNPAMRDFPLARINEFKHPLQKNRYRVWPLMNLAVAVDDIEMGITHVIRAKDHRDNAKRQKMIFKALGFGDKFPWTGFLGRINFKDFKLSTTQMRRDIESKKYSGWDDPNLLTIASLKKQGYKPEAFFNFAENRGISEADRTFDKKEFLILLKKFQKEKNRK